MNMENYKDNMLRCPHCGESSAVQMYDSINASSSPELKAAVMDGSAFLWECQHCGKRNLLRNQLLYHDPEAKLMFWLTLGDEDLETRAQEMYARISELSDYVLRFVDEPGELIEKVKIFDAGFDDAVMELCKHLTRMELMENSKELEEKLSDVPFRFLRADGSDHHLQFAYPQDGQMQVAEVGFNVYEDCAGIIRRNPQLTESLRGFCRVNTDWINEKFA